MPDDTADPTWLDTYRRERLAALEKLADWQRGELTRCYRLLALATESRALAQLELVDLEVQRLYKPPMPDDAFLQLLKDTRP